MNMRGTQAGAARFAVLSIFFLTGFGFANWVVRIPAVQTNLELGEGLLGLALLGLAVGSLAAMPTIGGFVSRFGSRPVVWTTAIAFPIVLPLPAFADGLAGLFIALFVMGTMHGGLDVAMNAQAVAVEKEYRRPIMSSFHAFFSLGGLVGAVVGGAVAELGIGVTTHLLGAAVAIAVGMFLACRKLLPASADVSEGGPAFARPTKALLGLGIISFCVLVGEGAMADWSAVYLNGTLGTGAGFAAAGFAVFSLMMTIGRFTGDWLIARFGAKALVRLGAAVAAVGLGTSLAVGNEYAALVGFGCAGIGFSIVFPAALSAAGRSEDSAPGPALAAVATAGYFGFLVGPPSIGFAAELLGLGGALYIVVALSAVVVVLAGAVGEGAK
ncbi:MAG: MFS transporter [Actinomycetota bacterium]|jgi:MFS family permease|nr:MFS transporter [Rubrobacter sp.]MDQ3507819.1 MFS transporter [Actinomycetota bacterium]